MLSRRISAASRLRGLLAGGPATTGACPRAFSHGRVVDAAARDGELRVFVVAGEVSGDSLASRLMASLRALSPVPVRFAGVGGGLMCKEGLQSLFPMEEISIMGLWELLPHLYNIKRKIEDTADAAILFQPHAVVTVDSKGFSFRLLKQLKCRYNQVAHPLHVHYVAPSFWAWKDGERRLAKLHNLVDHLLCILPFEEEICRINGLPATYVGHPLLDDAIGLNMEKELSSVNSMHQRSGEAFRQEHAMSPVAPHRDVRAYIENVVRSMQLPVVLIPGGTLKGRYDAFNASRAALCTSGTAVMELMLAKLPCVVAYKAHFITECLIHLRKNINFISLPNILLNSPILPEILFRACTAESLASKLSESSSSSGRYDCAAAVAARASDRDTSTSTRGRGAALPSLAGRRSAPAPAPTLRSKKRDMLREVICNDEVRKLQVESADQLLEMLYEPMKQRGCLFQKELHNSSLLSNIFSPSMIAALTVLYTDKHQHALHLN
uniref:lipid-A-disaccharide synthase n=1 Tax=Leersia perrieri TaxID=77586 RepID=A0A0D9V5Q4_9ORYZ